MVKYHVTRLYLKFELFLIWKCAKQVSFFPVSSVNSSERFCQNNLFAVLKSSSVH